MRLGVLLLVLTVATALKASYRVLHLTDLHFDPFFQAGAPSNCKHEHETFCCCRNNSIAEDPANPAPARPYGEYHCDSPLLLIDSMLNFTAGLGPFDAILWTGDNQPHDSYTITREQTLDDISFVTKMIRTFFPETPIFPALGNHDYWKTSQFKPPPASDWLLQNVSKVWAPFLRPGALSTLKTFGGYIEEFVTGIRIMSLNTLIYDSDNLNAYNPFYGNDPMNQFAWAELEFKRARLQNVSIWIIGHIPPGGATNSPASLSVHKFSSWYQRVAIEYSDVIRFNVFGHSHFNELRVISKNDLGIEGVATVYLSPAATPWLKQNPSVRIFELNSTKVLNYHQYFADIENQPSNASESIKWQHLYSAKDFYSLPDLSPNSWLNLLSRMKQNATLFHSYYQNWKSKCPKGHCALGEECSKHFICAQRHLSLPEVYKCTLNLL